METARANGLSVGVNIVEGALTLPARAEIAADRDSALNCAAARISIFARTGFEIAFGYKDA